MNGAPDELALRAVILAAVARRSEAAGGFLTRAELSDFDLPDGTRRRLLDASRGIWNPRDLAATLSIVSSPDGPYDDHEIEGGLFRYAYRSGSVEGDNTKLRRAGELGLPLVLFRKIDRGVYVPVLPVYVVDDDRVRRQFVIAVDESLRFLTSGSELSEVERRYAGQVTRRRLHQSAFRGMVVRAYDVRCTVCRLRHGELLDAAHITPDAEQTGAATVTNGLCLCKLHHAAYDGDLLAVTPDYRVEINRVLLEEEDGPMLRFGLQGMHGMALELPARRREWPDASRLASRYELFRAG